MSRTSDVAAAIRDALDPDSGEFNVATAVSIALNEACVVANQMRFTSRRLGCTPEEAYRAALEAAIAELRRLVEPT